MKNFAINFTGTYTRDEVPPRCRKPRPITHEASAQVEVPILAAGDAPVAFRVRGVEDTVREIRTVDGRLFSPYLPHAHQTEPSLPGSVHFPQDADVTRHRRLYLHAESEDEFHEGVEAYFGQFRIIDGVVWEEAAEPAYLVATFGLGGNGSVGLMVSDRKDHGTLFRADEFETARAWADEVARNLGDRSSRYEDPRFAERYRAIEVLAPDAVTLVTISPAPKEVRDLQFEYRMARDRLSRANTSDEETECFFEVTRLREEIIKHGHSPIESEARPYEARHGAEETL